MDVMFGLKDAPGFYLRAILHTDGNIQYANYVSAAQLGQWAAQNEVPTALSSTWLAAT
jgi:hypothetical protein